MAALPPSTLKKLSLEQLMDIDVTSVSRRPDGFATNGGMIRFIAAGTKIRFRINNEAARAVKLMISSKLLRLADKN